MNAAVVAIAPVTLIDLRSRRNPFDQSNFGPIRRMRYCLCALTVLFAALIAFYSNAVHREEGALREYEKIRAAQMPMKATALRKLVQQDKVLEKKDAGYEQYLRNLRELKDLEARRGSNQAALRQLADGPQWPFQLQLNEAATWIWRWPAPG